MLHSGPTAVSALAAAGRVVGAAVAVPLGPWVEFRRKRPVMVAMDLVRFAAVISVPAAFAFGIAALTALWGLLAGLIGPRAAIAVAGILLLVTPLLLPRCSHPLRREMQLASIHS